MIDKLCVAERRSRMLEYLCAKKKSTRVELAETFMVSTDTIDRDIVFFSSIAPIYTKQGNGGGIYILSEYRSYKNYLDDEEENCLYRLIDNVEGAEKQMICGIITKFTKNPLREYSNFQIKKQ